MEKWRKKKQSYNIRNEFLQCSHYPPEADRQDDKQKLYFRLIFEGIMKA